MANNGNQQPVQLGWSSKQKGSLLWRSSSGKPLNWLGKPEDEQNGNQQQQEGGSSQ